MRTPEPEPGGQTRIHGGPTITIRITQLKPLRIEARSEDLFAEPWMCKGDPAFVFDRILAEFYAAVRRWTQ